MSEGCTINQDSMLHDGLRVPENRALTRVHDRLGIGAIPWSDIAQCGRVKLCHSLLFPCAASSLTTTCTVALFCAMSEFCIPGEEWQGE